MPDSLPFLQNPKHFLESYFWGCNQGHKLSLRCRKQLEQMPSDESATHGAKPPRLTDTITDSVLDCHVHVRICSRCVPMKKVTCRRGYELLAARDGALDHARALGVEDQALDSELDNPELDSSGPDSSLSQQQLQAVVDRELARQQFLNHMGGCQICSLKQPTGRYTIAAWSIETARSQRLG